MQQPWCWLHGGALLCCSLQLAALLRVKAGRAGAALLLELTPRAAIPGAAHPTAASASLQGPLGTVPLVPNHSIPPCVPPASHPRCWGQPSLRTWLGEVPWERSQPPAPSRSSHGDCGACSET